MFEVNNEDSPLIVELMEAYSEGLCHMKTQITFDQIKEPTFPLQKEFWLNEKEYDDDAPKVLMMFDYIEQDIPRIQREIMNLKMDLQSEI